MAIGRNAVQVERFNTGAVLPYELRLQAFQMAMQDLYDFYEVNSPLCSQGLQRLADMLRPAMMSGVLSDMRTARLSKDPSPPAPNSSPGGRWFASTTQHARPTSRNRNGLERELSLSC